LAPLEVLRHLPSVQSSATAIAAGDQVWIAAAAPRIRRYLRCLRCPRDVVDDLVQETLLSALRHHGALEPALAWLLTTARNHWYQHCRVRRRHALLAGLPQLHERAMLELSDDGGDWRLHALTECVRGLPLRAQFALRLRYRDGLPPHAIAGQLGLSEAGTKTLLRRTKAALARCVERRRERDA
jgi:RNA polymerase sigma factor (sigma-70 family)